MKDKNKNHPQSNEPDIEGIHYFECGNGLRTDTPLGLKKFITEKLEYKNALVLFFNDSITFGTIEVKSYDDEEKKIYLNIEDFDFKNISILHDWATNRFNINKIVIESYLDFKSVYFELYFI